eukprot:429063-Heterocapsa_arctica.AAC.1
MTGDNAACKYARAYTRVARSSKVKRPDWTPRLHNVCAMRRAEAPTPPHFPSYVQARHMYGMTRHCHCGLTNS